MSSFEHVHLGPPDAILHLNTLYKVDPNPEKISVGVGAYRDEQGRPVILPVVRKAEQMVSQSTKDHEYLPIDGLKSFSVAASKLVLGKDSPAIKEERYVACQTLSGTGAVRLGAEFMGKFKKATVYISNPTWSNHFAIFQSSGLETAEYKYYDPQTRGLDMNGLVSAMENAPEGSIFLLHVCAHNPTGVDPSPDQWKQIASIMKRRKLFPFFDCAYQGFASGDLEKDVFAVRYFVDQGFEMMVAQSFAKNMGLYGERVGNLCVVLNSSKFVEQVSSQINLIVRAIYSTPPSYGARVADLILNTPELFEEWKIQLRKMADRINAMRKRLFGLLQELKTPGTWNHVVDQIGMFSYTGLSPSQSQTMVDRFHIYMTSNGRISMAGLNESNIERFAKALDWVVRNVKPESHKL